MNMFRDRMGQNIDRFFMQIQTVQKMGNVNYAYEIMKRITGLHPKIDIGSTALVI